MDEVLEDTITAIATPLGKGGVGVIRVSGPKVQEIAHDILGTVPPARKAVFAQFKNAKQDIIDSGLALFFPKPNSFTGEDVLELQGHGGPVIMNMLLNVILEQGARLAQPGEFSRQAFLNGKMDLAQAEAVADLIDASTQKAALCASRSLQGAFSAQINQLAEVLAQTRIYVEAAIDFPDEEVDFLSDGLILERIDSLIAQLNGLHKGAALGQILREGISCAIVGQPNAGKSSLFNCLTRNDTAIVTPIAGTTRDLIKETIQIDGLPIHLIDTAGIRVGADIVEEEGIKRAKAQLELADRILLVVDMTSEPLFSTIEQQIIDEFGEKVTVVMNKADMAQVNYGEREGKIYLCAKTGEGIDALHDTLKACAGFLQTQEGNFIARKRHVLALKQTQEHCQGARRQLVTYRALELVAQELRQAQESLGEIVGKTTADDLLGEIFATFCIGK